MAELKGNVAFIGSAYLSSQISKHNLHRVYAETIALNKPTMKLCKRFVMREEAGIGTSEINFM